MPNNAQQSGQNITIDWEDFVRFLRQLSHDVRNHLNAAELQAAYLNEIVETAELKDEVKRLREMVSEVSRSLQKVIVKVTPISATTIPYRCADLIEDVKQKLASVGSATPIQWDVQLSEATFEVDPQLVQDAILELLDNAGRQPPGAGPAVATARISDGKFEFTLREPKKEFTARTDTWGRDPLRTVDRGHYGLGLNRLRMIVEAHRGDFSATFDPQISTLISRIVLPLSAS